MRGWLPRRTSLVDGARSGNLDLSELDRYNSQYRSQMSDLWSI
jgi:hypothetical protein